jgi:nucleoside-diphosphate-sugar epimerase
VKAWVTGATGFVGRALAERLLARGDRVTALVRPSSEHRAPSGVEVVLGALPDAAPLAALSPPDVVFHCAAVIDGDEAAGRAVHVDGTLRISDAARGARFVHVSTTDVYARTTSGPLTESTRCAPRDAYGRTKLEGETCLLAARPDAVVLRPPGIYGPRATRDVVGHLAARIERGRFFYIGDGTPRRSWIFVETLVDAMLHAAERPDLAGIFLVDDGRSVSRREFATEVARALGRSARFPAVPAPLARAAAWTFERALPPLGMRSPLTSDGVDQSLADLPLDTSRWRATGFVPRFTFREAVARTAAARTGQPARGPSP